MKHIQAFPCICYGTACKYNIYFPCSFHFFLIMIPLSVILFYTWFLFISYILTRFQNCLTLCGKLFGANINIKNSKQTGGRIMYQEEFSDLITIDELCELLSIGRNYAYSLLNAGEIKAFRIGRTWKIPRGAVWEYIKRKSGL